MCVILHAPPKVINISMSYFHSLPGILLGAYRKMFMTLGWMNIKKIIYGIDMLISFGGIRWIQDIHTYRYASAINYYYNIYYLFNMCVNDYEIQNMIAGCMDSGDTKVIFAHKLVRFLP